MSEQLVDRRGRLWQERTVVVKKDSDGFGFTLSKEMPVFVDSVAPGSSSDRAGILAGDRIIKVNGVSVVGHKHNDVVEMIRDSSHVTLTVIGKIAQNGTKSAAPPGRTSSHEGVEISPPHQLQELTLQSLKLMLQGQRRTYESLTVEFGKQPSEKLEKELRDCESIVKILEMEVASKSPAIVSHLQTTGASVQALTGRQPRLHPTIDEQVLTRKLLMSGEGRRHPGSASPTKGMFGTNKGFGTGSPKQPSRAHTFSNGSVSSAKGWQKNLPPLPTGALVGDEGGSDFSDDDLSDEVDGASEFGPFASLQELRNNPAHMSVFMHYLYLNKEPKYLFFYLVSGSYQVQCKASDLKQRGMDIYWTFFLDASPLHLEVSEELKSRMLSSLEGEDTESKLRGVFVECREVVSEVIINDLAGYRQKRVIGMAGMFGDHMVTNQMTIVKQLEVVHAMLLPDLRQCMDERSNTNSEDTNRNHAIASCIGTFILDATGKTNSKNINPPLDRVQTFTQGDLLLKKGKSRKKTSSTMSRCGHTFVLTSYTRPTNCDYCSKLLWGVIYHGYQCQVCELNIHRYSCTSDFTETCPGKGKRRKSQPQRKLSLSVIVAPATPVETEPVETSPNDEEVPDRLSPQPAEGSAGVVVKVEGEEEGGGRRVKRDRSISEPKHHALGQTSSFAGTGDQPPVLLAEVPTRKHGAVTRTQSERLQERPNRFLKAESVDQHLSNTLNSSGPSTSDESLLSGGSKVGSLDAIAEGPGKSQQQMEEEDLSELLEDDIEDETIPWALAAKREVINSMKRYEIQRQEFIKELVYTERTHLYRLKIMRYIYKLPLQNQNVLSVKQVEQLFPSLEELIFFHGGLCEGLKERERSSSTSASSALVKNIADVLLQRFDGAAGERLCHACSVFASNQAKADRLFKEWKRQNERFRVFIKNAESHPLCKRLALSELMPIAWQRLTKYKLLIDNILNTYKKHWDELDDADKEEGQKVETALSCVKNILQYVNKQVRRAENRQRLSDFHSKLDTSPLEKATHPIAKMFKDIDISSENRRLFHEGPLTWRIQHRRVVELHALLLTDVLVLMEKHEDKDKYYLRCHTLEKVGGSREELSPVIRLKECLLRHAAADKGGRTFLMVNNSSLMKLAQMYEFIAEGPKEKKRWEEAIKRAMLGTQDVLSPDLPPSPTADDYSGRLPLGLSTHTSHLTVREQLDKIDDDMKKLLMDKLSILRPMQGNVTDRYELSPLPTPTKTSAAAAISTATASPKEIICATLEQTGEIMSTLSHIMVPNPAKSIVAETQSRVSDIITEMQRNLSKLLYVLGEVPLTPAPGDVVELELPVPSAPGNGLGAEEASNDLTLPHEVSDIPAADSWDSLLSAEDAQEGEREELGGEGGDEEASRSSDELQSGGSLTKIIAPPECFSGDDSATPTPQLDIESTGRGSGTLTPRTPPSELSPTTFSPPTIEDDTHIDIHDLEATNPDSPDVSAVQNKRDNVSPGVKVMTVIANAGESREEEDAQGFGQSSSQQSFRLTRFRPSSVTSSESEPSVQEHTQDLEEEGTDM